MSDATKQHPTTLRAHARLTIEAVTPLHIGSGREGTLSDADVVTDANGLPALPGSSFAGVLRSLTEASEADSIFGYSAARRGSSKNQGSRLRVSWGHIHDQHNRPVDGILAPDRFKDDDVLTNALAPALRDHVRITHRGTADTSDNGKFDELCVAKGHRFTLSLELLGKPGQEADQLKAEWEQLIQRIRSVPFRLGGRTRRGFGAVEVCEIQQRVFDLSVKEDLDDYLKLPVSLDEPLPASLLEPDQNQSEPENDDAVTTITLKLKPRFYWLFGGEDTGGSTADMAPVREVWVTWDDNGKGTLQDGFLLPGSSIKGAIAHRTAFHHNCLEGNWVEDGTATTGENNEAVKTLFGYVTKDQTAKETARRGSVLIDDILLPEKQAQPQRLNHVKIDRFTGGAWPGALFNEEPLYGSSTDGITVQIQLLADSMDDKALQALDRTLRDLCTGMLPLGGGAGRGHGRFEIIEKPSVQGALAGKFPETSQVCTSKPQPLAT